MRRPNRKLHPVIEVKGSWRPFDSFQFALEFSSLNLVPFLTAWCQARAKNMAKLEALIADRPAVTETLQIPASFGEKSQSKTKSINIIYIYILWCRFNYVPRSFTLRVPDSMKKEGVFQSTIGVLFLGCTGKLTRYHISSLDRIWWSCMQGGEWILLRLQRWTRNCPAVEIGGHIYIICFHHLNTATVDPALPAQCEEWSDDYMEPFPALEWRAWDPSCQGFVEDACICGTR